MKLKKIPRPLFILLALAVIAGVVLGVRALLGPSDTPLTASGTIEAAEVVVSPEIGGRVEEVLVGEGDPVSSGQVLFRLDDTLLEAQRAVVAASLDLANAAVRTAQANYTLALDAALLESTPGRTADWRSTSPTGYNLAGGSFSRSDWIAAAEAVLAAQEDDLHSAREELDLLLNDPAAAEFVAAEARLREGRAAALAAQDMLSRALASNNPDLRTAAQDARDDAQSELEAAQAAYDGLAGGQAAQAVIRGRLDLAVAQELYDSARDRLLALQIGADSPRVAAAQAALDQAELAAAQAEANLALLDTQIARLVVTSPADGVVLTLAIQPGEVAAAGSRALTMARLEDLSITVYVPEDRYGELSLGQAAEVSVDSFPGQTFPAEIRHIADQAEFTPRNVQTIEGRSSTVFAIELGLANPDGRLKPGMPADVRFLP